MAGCGQGHDAADLDADGRACCRRHALDWLRVELGAWHRLLAQNPQSAAGLGQWLADPAFAGVRDPDALADLPACERRAWQALWAEAADAARQE
jgi:hypothetical protein